MPLNTGSIHSPSGINTVIGIDQTTGLDNLKVPGSLVFMTMDDEPLGGGSPTLYLMPKAHSFKEGYKEIAEAGGGTNKPGMAVGAFKGTISMDLIYTTDLPTSWSTIVNGDLVTKQVVFYFMDKLAHKTKITLTECRIYDHGGEHRNDEIYRRTVTISYPNPGVWGTWT